MCRFNLTTASVLLQVDGIINTVEYGLMGSVFALTYSIGRILNGYLGDRANSRLMIVAGISLAGVANLLLGLFPEFGLILFLWAINGYAQSMIWGPLLCITTNGFGERKGIAGSILTSSVSVGSILGILLSRLFLNDVALRFVFIAPGVIAVGFGIFTFAALKTKSKKQPKGKLEFKETLSHIKQIMPMTVSAFLHGFMKDSVSAWAALIFFKCYSIDIERISSFVLLVPAIGTIGRFIYPFAYRRLDDENKILAIGFATCGMAGVLLCVSRSVILTALCLCGIAASVSIINTGMLSTFPMRFEKVGLVSSVSGCMDFATYMGSALSSAIFGAMLSGNAPLFKGMYICWICVSLISLGIHIGGIKRKKEGKRCVYQ